MLVRSRVLPMDNKSVFFLSFFVHSYIFINCATSIHLQSLSRLGCRPSHLQRQDHRIISHLLGAMKATGIGDLTMIYINGPQFLFTHNPPPKGHRW